MVPTVLKTLPPLEITMELPDPTQPTPRRAELLQSELLPVTNTLLSEENRSPMVPAELKTLPPLEITMELPDP
jgi:hypothetical protein